MSKHLQRDLEYLKKELLSIASLVEEATNKAILALTERRSELAEEVISEDNLIDQKEVQVEDECLKVLALHQPVAADLRFIITALKVNNDLERMGDLAVNIAERAAYLSTHEHLGAALDFPRMAEGVQTMLRNSLDALTNMDAKLARGVLKMDDEIDAANKQMYVILQKWMHKNPDSIERAVHLLSASRHLERIADLATNIAEDVVYMAEGELIRHRVEDFSEKK
ncbi:MAG: phosphate signaling complex protein PhoU [Actinobacteria bacterium]|nr:phosphate signaling complex protein PhoU [Actinomycetota bacterium]